MRFVYPYMLLALSLLPVVALVWIWLHRRAGRRLSLLIAPALQGKLLPKSWQGAFYSQFALAVAGLALLIFAAARPQWGRSDEKSVTRSRNVVIALDVSRSMLAADVHPNRLERAKADILDLIDDLKGDRAALLAFRSKGILLCPLTTDYAFLRQALDGASPESAPRGETDLGDAIRKSLAALDPALDENNAILMISDGEDLKGDAVDAARKAAERNIPIFTVGIGDPAGATIPGDKGQGPQKYRGTAVKTHLVGKTLSAIAEASHGRYIPLGTAGTAQTTLGAIYRRYLTQVAAREQVEQIENRYQERYQLFLVPALFCLLGAAFFSRGRLSLKPCVAKAAAAIVIAFALPAMGGTNAVPESATNAPPIVVEPGRAGARKAQGYLARGKYREAAEAFLSAMRGADLEEAESYRYNAAYAYYMAKDPERAAEALRPLLSSRKNGAKAGEFLGKLMMEESAATRAQSSTNAPSEPPESAKYKALREAAEGFQRALRDAPEDARRNRNLTRAVSPLAEARDAAHIAEVLKEMGKTPPQQLAGQMLAEQRAIMKSSEGVFTNDAPAMIAQAEALAKRQEKQADIWIPLKQQMLQAVTNQEQQANMARQIELVRDSMKGAASAWRDAAPDAAAESAESEPAAYQFWKLVAPPDAALNEDIMCQSNSIRSLNEPYYKGKDTQAEALDLTRRFQKAFPQWAQQYRQQAQSDTNAPPFTEEDQKKISELMEHAEGLQKEAAEPKAAAPDRPALQAQALKDLLEARELMPKQKNQGQSQQQQQQNQQQQQDQKQQEQQRKQDEQKQQEEQKQEEQKKDERKEPPKDAQEVMRRALEREKEHEQEKKERMRNMPLAPNERDW